MKDNKSKINKEKGFNIIENELYNWAIKAKGLGKCEMQIVHAIIRQTNGYHREWALISYRYFEGLTGIDHRNIGKYLNGDKSKDRKGLIEKRIVKRNRGNKDKYGQPVYYYKINKEYCRLPDYSKNDDSNEDDNRPVIKPAPEPVVNSMSNKERKEIKNIETRNIVEKLMNYKKHREKENSNSNENRKDDSKTENCGSKEK